MNMKKHFTYLIAIYTLIIVAMPACDKDDDDPQPKTKTELITASSWKLSTATVGGMNALPFIQDCQEDNTMVFVAGGTGTVSEGATKCNAGDPDTTPFTWNFQDSETKLFVSSVLFTGGNNTSTIVTLSETQLVLSQEVIFGGTPYTAIVTFIH
jgi:hypothetical protein